MTGFEPGVQLTADTIAAMERLSTSPSKPAMTKQHKATPEQWDDAGAFASDTRACLLELRARVELLEATQHAHIDTSRLSDEERDQIRQELSWPAAWQLLKIAPIRSGPESPLVERVADAIAAQATSAGIVNDRPARAAILEIAAWFRTERDSPETAAALEQEANR